MSARARGEVRSPGSESITRFCCTEPRRIDRRPVATRRASSAPRGTRGGPAREVPGLAHARRHHDNARNFRNWQYSEIATDVPFTEEMIASAIDVRLPLQFEDEEITQIGLVLLAALDDTIGHQA